MKGNDRGRPVLVAPDKFKGTLTAAEVAGAIGRGLARAEIEADLCPVADGGDGTLEIVVDALGGEFVSTKARDALGQMVDCRFGLLDDGRTALVEVAESIGLARLESTGNKPDAATAWKATSHGAGDLIAAAAETGVKRIYVAIGGTASTDGGAGAVEAINAAGLFFAPRRKRPVELTVIADVRADWEQAATVFAQQKGADPATSRRLSIRLEKLAAELSKDPRNVAMTGAGGGLAGALWASAGAELKPGAAFVLDVLGFNARMDVARCVITGEGRIDHQTLLGKSVGEIATRSRQAGVPCHAIVGEQALPQFETRLLDIETVVEAGTASKISVAVDQLLAKIAPN